MTKYVFLSDYESTNPYSCDLQGRHTHPLFLRHPSPLRPNIYYQFSYDCPDLWKIELDDGMEAI